MHNIAKLGGRRGGRTSARMYNQYFPPFCDGQHTRPNKSALFCVMAARKKTLGELKSEAIAELERRGYDVRGKTPAQIRQILRRRPTKSKSMKNHQRSKLDQ